MLYSHADALKAAPPAVVTVGGLFGVPWATIVYVLTAVYLFLQIYFLVRDKWWRDKEDKDGRD